MSNRGLLDSILSRGPSAQTVAELAATLEDVLEPDEQIQYRLPGAGRLVYDTSDGGERFGGTDSSVAVVTDYRLLFVTRSGTDERIFDLPHTDIRSVDLDSGLLRTVLTIETWGDDAYEFHPTGGEISEAIAYIERTSKSWQLADVLLEELDGYAETVETHIRDGEFDRVTDVLADARETADELEQRVAAAGLEGPLGDRVQAARRDLQRTRIEARLELARDRISAAESRHLDGKQDYRGAYEQYAVARDHVSTALSIAHEHDIDDSEAASVRDRVDGRISLLARQPIALAKQATERALGTDNAETRVETMQAALEHYHDALTLGWGTDLDPVYDRTELRYRVALLASGLVDARQEYAMRLEAAGDALAKNGDGRGARERYRTAVEQLAAAADLAHEFHTPDPDSVERERSRLEAKLAEYTD